MTGEEFCVLYYDKDYRKQLKGYKWKNEQAWTIPKSQLTVRKCVTMIFWDLAGTLVMNYIRHNSTISSPNYPTNIRKIKLFHPEKSKLKHSKSNSTPRKKSISIPEFLVDALMKFDFGEMSYLLYSLDLASKYYYLFSDLKKSFRGRTVLSDNQDKSRHDL